MTDRSLAEFVRRHRVIGLDTNVLIAHFEQAALYAKTASRLLQEFETTNARGMLSVITIPEVLIRPIRLKNDSLRDQYERLVFGGRFELAPITQSVAEHAAVIGGRSKLQTLDALIVASLIEAGATGFVTADQDFKHVTELDVLVLSGKRPR